MLKKRFISLFLALAMLLGLSGQAFAVQAPKETGPFSMNLTENVQLEAQVFENRPQAYGATTNFVQVDINEARDVAHVTLQYQGCTYSANLTGSSETVKAGHVGFYQGILCSIDGNEETIPAIADITFNGTDMFVALTLRMSNDEDVVPVVLFFGNFAEELAEISTTYAQTSMELRTEADEQNRQNTDLQSTRATSDTSLYLRGATTVKTGSYNLGNFYLILQNSTINGGNAIVRVKATSNSAYNANCEKYLLNDAGLRYTLKKGSVHLDRINFTLSTTEPNVAFYGATPGDLKESYPIGIPIPTISGAALSIDDFINGSLTTINIEVSSTTLSPKGTSGVKQYDWSIYKLGGWSDSEIDGSASTKTGVAVGADARYNGILSQNVKPSISAEGELVFAYSANLGNGLAKLHISFPSAKMTGQYTVTP